MARMTTEQTRTLMNESMSLFGKSRLDEYPKGEKYEKKCLACGHKYRDHINFLAEGGSKCHHKDKSKCSCKEFKAAVVKEAGGLNNRECMQCGHMVNYGAEFCSEKCQKEYEDAYGKEGEKDGDTIKNEMRPASDDGFDIPPTPGSFAKNRHQV